MSANHRMSMLALRFFGGVKLRGVLLCVLVLAGCTIVACKRQMRAIPATKPTVVSFSPAITDMIYYMGLGTHVVGVTRFCRLPEGVNVPVVGDRGSINTEAILSVDPDVVLIQQNPQDFGALARVKPEIKIEHFTIETLDDIPAAAERIADLLGEPAAGQAHAKRFRTMLNAVRESVAGLQRPRVLFICGYERPIAAGEGTFTGGFIELAGGQNAAQQYRMWSNLNSEAVVALAPDVLICQVLPAEVTAATDYWNAFNTVPAVRNRRVHVVTDDDWIVPSLRIADLAKELADIIHPRNERMKD